MSAHPKFNRRHLMIMAASAGGLMTVPQAANAFNRQAYAPPLEGLVPPGFKVVKAMPPFDKADMRASQLSLIPSLNLDRYSQVWDEKVRNHKPGLLERVVGVRDSTNDGLKVTTDPRLFADRTIEALQPFFQSVNVATDFPSGRESGSRYFCVIDYWVKVKGMLNAYTDVQASLHLFDPQLQAIVAETYRGRADYKETSFMPSAQESADSATQLFGESMEGAINALLSAAVRQLSL